MAINAAKHFFSVSHEETQIPFLGFSNAFSISISQVKLTVDRGRVVRRCDRSGPFTESSASSALHLVVPSRTSRKPHGWRARQGATAEATHRTSGAMPAFESLAQKRRRELEARCVSPPTPLPRPRYGLIPRSPFFRRGVAVAGDADLGLVDPRGLRCVASDRRPRRRESHRRHGHVSAARLRARPATAPRDPVSVRRPNPVPSTRPLG